MSSSKRSVLVMDLLARKSPLGVRAVATQLGFPLGSVHRLLLDLEEVGITERTPAGEWELSFRLLEITGLQLERIEVPRLFHPYAEKIALATGETVNLNVLSGLNSVCIDKVRGNDGMQLDVRIGSRGSMHCGGAGKAMLSYMTAEDQARVFEAPLLALTSRTITDLDLLKAELARIKARGYSIDDQEVVMGVYCVAVPILDRNSRPFGAMSITGPLVKAPGPEIAPMAAMLNEACGAISRRLGYSGPWPLLAETGEAVPPGAPSGSG